MSKVSIYLTTSIILLFFFEFILSLPSSYKTENYANTQEFQKKYVVRNSHGYRDKEYSYKKPDNIFRVLVLGDSQTFGHGVKKLEDTWHKKLEVLMNRGLKGKKFEIISLAGEGWNTDKQLYELFKNGFKYNPDLILLTISQYTVPRPYEFKCQGEDILLFPGSKIITRFRKHSKIYPIFEYRINRVLEILGRKPTYPECINKRFDSRGWDMEEIYLDTILMSSQIKNIHFMITIIPLVYKLDEEYPLKSSHAKVKKYCAKKGIECLDLYDEGFKGLDYTTLVYSKTDKHLNEKGTEVVAKNLYKKLQPLKTYKNLSKFHGAFDLNELLNQKPILKKLDEQFKEIKKKNIIELNNKNLRITAESLNGNLKVKKIFIEKQKKFIISFILEKNGNFHTKSLKVLDKKTLQYKESIKNGNLIKVSKSLKKPDSKSFYYKNSTSEFLFTLKLRTKFSGHLLIEKDLKFFDPQVSEKIILGTAYAATKSLLFDKFLFYLRYSWITYVNNLIDKILIHNPSSGAKKTISNIKSITITLDKIKNLQQQYKSFAYNFIPVGDILTHKEIKTNN
jgi:hypothetical protein